MKTNIMVCLLVLFLSATFVTNGFSQDRSYRITRDVYSMPNDNYVPVYNNPVHTPITLLPALLTGDASIGPEQLTTLTGWYDYMTNGDCRHWILMDPTTPNNLHVHYCVSDSLNPSGSTSRRTVYAFSSDGGTTWTYGSEVPQSFRSGFGYMDLKTDGSAIISNHNARQSTGLNTHLYVDLYPLLASFTEYLTPATTRGGAWGQCSRMTNGNVLLVGESYTGGAGTDSTVYTIFNGTTTAAWTLMTPPTGITMTNQRWCSAAGANGNACIVVNPISDVNGGYGANKIYAYTSTNNGVNWSSPTAIFTPYVNGGVDSIAPFFGQDLVYKPGTSDYYFAFNTTGNNLFKKSQLWISKNGGTAHLIADSSNVPNTATMLSMAGITGIDHPSIGFSADNQVIYCAFTVMTSDTGLRGWNTRDVFYSFSTNDGVNWAVPVRVTHTPLIDEGYPAISKVNPGTSPSTYALHLVYMKDPGDGPSAFNGTSTLADPTRNWLIYRKITMPTVGIRQSGTVVANYSLSQNYPNPFNPTTKINFSISKSSNVSLKVYDITGKLVTTLVNERLSTGSYEYSFDGKNLSSGIYFYTIKADGYVETKKMTLVK